MHPRLWEITDIDTVKAFTQAVFEDDEELYMEVADKNVKGCLLLCPFEGCKQSALLPVPESCSASDDSAER